MYPVSESFLKALGGKSRTERVNGSITLKTGEVIPFSDRDLQGGSLTIDNQCVSGEELQFGAVYAGQLSMTLHTELDRYRFYDGIITLSWGLLLPDGDWETVPFGVYQITEAVRQFQSVTIKALDAMLLLDKDYDKTVVYGTPFEILTWISGQAGVPFVNTQEEIEGFPNGGQRFQLDGNCGCATLRDGVSILAQMLAGFATADREGRLKLCRMGVEPCFSVPADQRFSTEAADFEAIYMGVKFVQTDGDVESYEVDRPDGLIMTVAQNPLMEYGLPEVRQAMADAVRVELCQYRYTPGTLSYVGNPALECGDLIGYTVGETTLQTLLTGYNWQYRGEHQLKGVGKNPYLIGMDSKEARRLSQIERQIASDVSAVVGYENIKAYSLTATPKQIVKMRFVTLKETSAVFQASLLLEVDTNEEQTVSEKGYTLEKGTDGSYSLKETIAEKPITVAAEQTVSFTYRLNQNENTQFYPMQTVKTGRYILSLQYPLMGMPTNSVQDFEVLATISGGVGRIGQFQLKAAIIGPGMKAAEGIWDGTLLIEEYIPPFLARLAISFSAVEQFETLVSAPHLPDTVSQGISPFSAGIRVSFCGLTETLTVNPVWEQQTIDPDRSIQWEYNERYVIKNQEKQMVLNREYQYESVPMEMVSGSGCRVDILTSEFSRVEEVLLLCQT